MNHQDNPLFTLRKPGERPLLEIWHIGYGPNISYGICVAEPPRAWESDQGFEPSQQPLVVRCGYPPGYPLAPGDAIGEEGSITRAAFEELLEPLKQIRVPPCP